MPARSPSRSDDGILRHLGIVFLISVVFYVAWFAGTEYWRHRRGPWRVSFGADAERHPTVMVSHAKLGIPGVSLVFPGETVPPPFTPVTVEFDRPEKKAGLPFGKVVFLDTTFLPGTVTFEFFGHQVELLPRVLILDKQERAWNSSARHELRHP